jgi:tRNA dimethylallyltransferase
VAGRHCTPTWPVDPAAAARIHATDAQRIQRALEVQRLSGRPISAWQRESPPRASRARAQAGVAPARPRGMLHARIEQRFDAMLGPASSTKCAPARAAAVARASRAAGLPAVRAVGYRQAWEFLDGACRGRRSATRAIFATRQLAKRQLTWLRGELDARWFDPAQRGNSTMRSQDFLGKLALTRAFAASCV